MTISPTTATVQNQTSSLRNERDRFVAFAFAGADLLIETDPQDTIVYAAGAAQRLYGCNTDALPGQRFADLVHPEDRAMYRSLVQSIRRGGRFVRSRVRMEGPDRPPTLLGACALPGGGRSVFLAVTEASRLPEPGAGGTSPLSKDEFLAAAEKLLQHRSDEPYKLSFVSVDGIEALQDRLPELGNGLVTAVERQLQAADGGVEIVGHVGAGRYGLVHKRTLDTVELQRQVEGFSKSLDPTGAGLIMHSATVELDKIGLSEGDAARALVYAVQEFAAKGDSGFTLTSLRGSLDALVQSAAVRIASLRSTVDAGAFRLAYQPVVELDGRAIHHLEALARFSENASTGGTVAFAEASGLITDFDIAVCQRVIALLADPRTNQVPIAINVSGRSLESKIFCAEFEQALAGCRSQSRSLLIEITESSAVTRIDEVNALVQSLRAKGFRVCLDDFGAGAASFQYLRRFDIDFVKIDGNFARDSMNRPRDQTLLQRVIDFCRDVRIQVIVEMIEAEDQVTAFRKLGAQFGQGYLLGRPDFDLAKFTAAKPPKPIIAAKRRGYTETWM